MTVKDKLNFIIEEEFDGTRVDLVLSLLMPEISRSYIQKLLQEGRAKINGKTISSKKEKVFERFYQADNSTTKKSKGTGSKYLKGRKDAGASAGGTAGGSTGKSGNLTGAVGGYNTSGISSSAKKINPPCQSTIRDSKKRPGKNTVSSE